MGKNPRATGASSFDDIAGAVAAGESQQPQSEEPIDDATETVAPPAPDPAAVVAPEPPKTMDLAYDGEAPLIGVTIFGEDHSPRILGYVERGGVLRDVAAADAQKVLAARKDFKLVSPTPATDEG